MFQRLDGSTSTVIIATNKSSWKDGAFSSMIEDLIREGRNKLALDLGGCTALDPVDAREIDRVRKNVSAADGILVLVGLCPEVTTSFRDAMILSKFETFPDLKEALYRLSLRPVPSDK